MAILPNLATDSMKSKSQLPFFCTNWQANHKIKMEMEATLPPKKPKLKAI